MFGSSSSAGGRGKKKRERTGPWWKRVLRTVLISAGTALVVGLVDALLYPQTDDDGKGR